MTIEQKFDEEGEGSSEKGFLWKCFQSWCRENDFEVIGNYTNYYHTIMEHHVFLF
jgi:hypothetical protein